MFQPERKELVYGVSDRALKSIFRHYQGPN